MSDSGPPPTSGRPIATGNQRTVKLKLNVKDLLKAGVQLPLDGRQFKVSARMAFKCKDSTQSQTDHGSTSQPLQRPQQIGDPEKLRVVNSIYNNRTTLNDASNLLLNCANYLEQLKAELNGLSGTNGKSLEVKQNAKEKVKCISDTVIDMLKKLDGDTATVNTTANDNPPNVPQQNAPQRNAPQQNATQQKEFRLEEYIENTREVYRIVSSISMDVLLALYFAVMIDIRNSGSKPKLLESNLCSLLNNICEFHGTNDYEKYADVVPADVFQKLLGEGWEEKQGIASRICEQLVHFFAQETAKACAQDIIAYLNYHHDKITNADGPEEVLSMEQLFVQLQKEVCSVIAAVVLEKFESYGKHRLRIREDESSPYVWRDIPTKFIDNQHVINRFDYYDQNQDTFEERLIVGCYKLLLSQKDVLKNYHDIMSFDLDYVCQSEDETTELQFFGTIFELDINLLKSLYGEVDGDDEPVVPEVASSPEAEEESDSIDGEEVRFSIVPSVALQIFFSTIMSIRCKKIQLKKVNFPDFLREIYLFPQTYHWTHYRDLDYEPHHLFSKVSKRGEAWKDKNEKKYEFCRRMEQIHSYPDFGMYVKEFIGFMDHTYDNAPDKSVDPSNIAKVNFFKKFAAKFDEECQKWICSMFKDNLKVYLNYHKDSKKCLPKYQQQTMKYSWKPKPVPFENSLDLKSRMDYHLPRVHQFQDSRIIFSFYNYLLDALKSDDVLSELREVLPEFHDILDDDFDFMWTRPQEMVKLAERKLFNSLFRLDKWSHWFYNFILNLPLD